MLANSSTRSPARGPDGFVISSSRFERSARPACSSTLAVTDLCTYSSSFFVTILCIQFPQSITAHKTPDAIERSKSSAGSTENSMTTNIDGKIVIITGASSGLGEAAARHLSSLGAVIVLGARRIDRIGALAQELTAAGGRATAVATDVTQFDQVQRLVDTAVETYGRVDVLINNAGIMPQSPLDRRKISPDTSSTSPRSPGTRSEPEERSMQRPSMRYVSSPDVAETTKKFLRLGRHPRRLLRTRGRLRHRSARGHRHQRDPLPSDPSGVLKGSLCAPDAGSVIYAWTPLLAPGDGARRNGKNRLLRKSPADTNDTSSPTGKISAKVMGRR